MKRRHVRRYAEPERRSARELELSKIRDAYANAATVEARLRMKREIQKLEVRSI